MGGVGGGMVLLLKKGDPGSYVCSLVKSVTWMTFPPNSADSTLNPISLRVSTRAA